MHILTKMECRAWILNILKITYEGIGSGKKKWWEKAIECRNMIRKIDIPV